MFYRKNKIVTSNGKPQGMLLLAMLFFSINSGQGCRKYGVVHKIVSVIFCCRYPRQASQEFHNIDDVFGQESTAHSNRYTSSINDEMENPTFNMIQRLKNNKALSNHSSHKENPQKTPGHFMSIHDIEKKIDDMHFPELDSEHPEKTPLIDNKSSSSGRARSQTAHVKKY